MECLFVGGPWDGFSRRMKHVEKFIVAYMNPKTPVATTLEQTVSVERVIYTPHFWRTGEHERIIYAPEDWTDLQVMDTLINGYSSEAPSASLPPPAR